MEDHGSSAAKPDGAAKSKLNGERWTCREYGSPRGIYFIRNEADQSIAQSLRCGPERAYLMAAAPELLDAALPLLAEISEYLPSAGEDNDEWVTVRLGDLKALQRAAAKATGEQA